MRVMTEQVKNTVTRSVLPATSRSLAAGGAWRFEGVWRVALFRGSTRTFAGLQASLCPVAQSTYSFYGRRPLSRWTSFDYFTETQTEARPRARNAALQRVRSNP